MTKMIPLTEKQKCLAKISIFTTFGQIPQLEQALNDCLETGWTVNEINEALIQLYGYTGMPRSLNAVKTFIRVTEKREQEGKTVVRGKEQVTPDKSIDRYENGRKIMNGLFGSPVTETDWAKFCPSLSYVIYTALAEVYLRDLLDYATREFVTLTSLASQQGLTYEVQLHLQMSKTAGVTFQEIEALSEIIAEHVSPETANSLCVEARKIFA